jgi:hypothetical protein
MVGGRQDGDDEMKEFSTNLLITPGKAGQISKR